MLGRGPISSSAPLGGESEALVYSTGFSWPMMWEGTGIPAAYVNTDAGDAYGYIDPDGNTVTKVWSDNPALCLADFLGDTTFGARKTIDWESVGTAAAYCDELVGTPAEKRNQMTLLLAEKQQVRDWVNTMRAYVPCWVTDVAGKATLITDKPTSVSHVFNATNIDGEAPPRMSKKGIQDVPNVVQIGYTRTDVKPWATGYAEAVFGTPTVRRITRIEMPGIRRHSQASRFAIERLNHYSLEDLECEIGIFDYGVKVLLGDVCTVTDDNGLAAKPFRVMRVQDKGHGRWSLALREYDAAAYNNAVQTAPSTPDTGLPNPRIVAAPTGLSAQETVYLERDPAAVGNLASGFIYQSRFDISWTAPTHAYPLEYRVEVWKAGVRLIEAFVYNTSYSTPPVQQGVEYTIKVWSRNSFAFECEAPVQLTKTAVGKAAPPGPVPNILSAFEVGGEVILYWEAAIDIDVIRYEWRYFPNGTGTWETALLIDRVDGLRARFKGLPIGTHRFYVRAIDSVGNYSTSDKYVDVTVTTDANAFILDHSFSNPTLTNMIELVQNEGEWVKRWATRIAADQFTTVMPNPINSGSDPWISYHSSGASKFVGESWDLSVSITGDWSLTGNVQLLEGTVSYSIETSEDGSNWISNAGISFKGAARFVRPVIETNTTGTILITAPPKISLAAVTRTESGSTTTLGAGSGGKLVELSGEYAAAQDLQATAVIAPGSAVSSRTVVFDRVLLHPQQGLDMIATVNGGGNDYHYQRIHDGAALGRVIAATDYLEFKIWIDSTCPIYSGMSMDVIAVSPAVNLRDTGASDAYGTTFATLPAGQWITRRLSMSAMAGSTISSICMALEADTNGDYEFLVKDVRITDNAGTPVTQLSVYGSTGEPQSNITVIGPSGVINAQIGPSNSFLLYCFEAGGAPTAQAVRWSFKGF